MSALQQEVIKVLSHIQIKQEDSADAIGRQREEEKARARVNYQHQSVSALSGERNEGPSAPTSASKEGEKKKMSDELRDQINDIIEGEIQLGINDYLEDKQEKEKQQGMGFVTSEEAKNLKVKVSNSEIDKIIKEYKKIKRREKSNLSQVKKLGLVDKNGRPL